MPETNNEEVSVDVDLRKQMKHLHSEVVINSNRISILRMNKRQYFNWERLLCAREAFEKRKHHQEKNESTELVFSRR